MGDRINLYRPLYLVLLALTGAAIAVSYFFNLTYFYIAGGIWLAAALTTLIWSWILRSKNRRFLDEIRKSLFSAQRQSAAAFSMPTLIARENGDIIWNNDSFQQHVLPGSNVFGDSIFKLLPDLSYGEPCPPEGRSVTLGGRMYTAYLVQTKRDKEPLYVVYLIDDNDLKTYTKEYFDSRPSVLTMLIDNYAEIFQEAKENERSKITGEIEHVIETFTERYKGVVKKLEKDRYLAVIEERYMREIYHNRFAILDEIRSIDAGDRLTPTMSIGVGFQEGDLHESEKLSQQALDMALGRGGDQAAVKLKNGFEFYGGVSKGVEKRNKVRTRIVANAISEIVATSSNVLIMGHKYGDLDCLGSAVGLAAAMRQMGKQCNIVFDAEHSMAMPLYQLVRAEVQRDLIVTPERASNLIAKDTLMVIVDTHIKTMLEAPSLYDLCGNVIVIDHHRKMVNHIDDAIIFYHEPYASSASEMVAELLQYLGDGRLRISQTEAESMLSGIMLDTKNFTLHTGVRTFEAAAYLRRLGADTVDARKMYSSDMVAYKEKTTIVASAEVHAGCAVAWTNEHGENIRIVAAQAADELLNISEVESSFVIFPIEGGAAVSARSLGNVNVQLIMESIGGGGHQLMAAAQLPDTTVEQCRDAVVKAIKKYMAQNSQQ